MYTFHDGIIDFHDAMYTCHDGIQAFHDANMLCCACLLQMLQDAATVWMDTAGSVMCNIGVCRKHGAKNVLNTLYCKDPTYVEGSAPGKRAHKGSALYSSILSTDWGINSSNMRDDDAKLVVKMFRGLFASEVPNTPVLFQNSRAVFTASETNSCLGLSSMTENAHNFYKGGWWQWRRVNDIRSLLDDVPAVCAGQDRLANNEDYGPYGQPETRPVEEAAGAKLATNERAGSADTHSNESELEGPSLGAYSFMHVHRHSVCVR